MGKILDTPDDTSEDNTVVQEKLKTAKGVVPPISVIQVADLAQDEEKGTDSVSNYDGSEVSQGRAGSRVSEESGSSMTRLRFQIQVQREAIHEQEQLEDEEFQLEKQQKEQKRQQEEQELRLKRDREEQELQLKRK